MVSYNTVNIGTGNIASQPYTMLINRLWPTSLRPNSLEILKISNLYVSLEITNSRLQPLLLGANDSTSKQNQEILHDIHIIIRFIYHHRLDICSIVW